MPTSNENVAKILAGIRDAIVQHNGNCPGEIVAIEMHPIEIERLDFDTFNGIPIEENEQMQTGAFHLICDIEDQRPPAPSSGEQVKTPEKVGAS